MLIGVRKRFVFIANSKTASTSIEALLVRHAEINRVGSPERKHIVWRDALKEYGFLFTQPQFVPHKFFKFGVIREPVDWVRSWYNYRLANPRVEDPLPADETFEHYWKERQDWVKKISQSNMFTNAKGQCAMDLLIPLGDLPEAMAAILQRLGLQPAPLPRQNKSPGSLARQDIPEDLAREIQSHYAEDVALYEHWKATWRNTLCNYERKKEAK